MKIHNDAQIHYLYLKLTKLEFFYRLEVLSQKNKMRDICVVLFVGFMIRIF